MTKKATEALNGKVPAKQYDMVCCIAGENYGVVIGGSAKHLLGLINDILDMSRIESGRVALKNEEFSSREMLGQINTMIHGQCDGRGLTYDCAR